MKHNAQTSSKVVVGSIGLARSVLGDRPSSLFLVVNWTVQVVNSLTKSVDPAWSKRLKYEMTSFTQILRKKQLSGRVCVSGLIG